VDWLPYYKLALAVLVQAYGALSAVAADIFPYAAAPMPRRNGWRRSIDAADALTRLHLRPCGVGPDRSPEKAAEAEDVIRRTWDRRHGGA